MAISRSFYNDYKAAKNAQRIDSKNVTIFQLTKAGKRSKMHGATQYFDSKAEAEKYMLRIRTNNPNTEFRWEMEIK